MELVVLPDPDAVARVAADAVEQALRRSPAVVLGLPTGSTPEPLYAELVRRHRAGILTFAAARVFLLDEYVGLPPGHPQRYAAVIRRSFTGHVDIPDAAVHGPDGYAPDLIAECDRYEASIDAAGGVDIQVAGIGSDGHLAFNEPGSSLSSRTRLKTLDASTRADNARFFAAESAVPLHVLTQGLGTILRSRHLVLLATGAAKAEAVARAAEGPLTASCPASVLQLHPHATVLVDEAAATGLSRRTYYDDTWAMRPAWQPL